MNFSSGIFSPLGSIHCATSSLRVPAANLGSFKNQGAVLEMSVMFYAFNKLIAKGFSGMIPPAMIKSATEWG